MVTSPLHPGPETSRILQSLQLFPENTPIRNLQIIRPTEDYEHKEVPKLVVVSDDEVKSVPLELCSVGVAPNPYEGCTKCLAMRSPYCGWDLEQGACVPLTTWSRSDKVLQDLHLGSHPFCPSPPPPPTPSTTTTTSTTTTSTSTTTGKIDFI